MSLFKKRQTIESVIKEETWQAELFLCCDLVFNYNLSDFLNLFDTETSISELFIFSTNNDGT